MPYDEADPRLPSTVHAVDLRAAFEPERLSQPLRLVILLGTAAFLWGVIIAGGWSLYRFIA
jgi:hypothetical protein